ncbi:MAG: MFS transporter, partial [Acidimicrobiales bacterium]
AAFDRAGGVVGAVSASAVARRLGSARALWVSMLVAEPFGLLLPLTFPGPGLALFAAGSFVVALGGTVYNVNQVSFRQALCPTRLLGRMNATMRFLVWGTLPLGGLLGGALGTWLGNRGALWVAVAGEGLAALWLLASPLRGMRDLPDDPSLLRAAG